MGGGRGKKGNQEVGRGGGEGERGRGVAKGRSKREATFG